MPSQIRQSGKCIALLAIAAFQLGLGGAALIRAETVPVLPSHVDRDPDLSFTEPDTFFPVGLRELWTEALKQDEADVKQLAARSIAIANQSGMREWDPTIPLLLANLQDERRAVRLATAVALVELRSTDSAEQLAKASDRDGLEMSQLVEPALADWGYQKRESRWLEWIASDHQQGLAKLGMQCLGAVKSEKAAPVMLKIVTESRQASLRVAAAQAVGSYVDKGLEPTAEALAAHVGRGPKAIPRFLAAVLLSLHESPAALELLNTLMRDDDPLVISAAARLVFDREPQKVVDAREHILARGDANARAVLVRSLASLPDDETIQLLGDRLDDVSISVRSLARESLAAAAKRAPLRAFVTREARRMLASDSWRANEQAARLVVVLDDQESAERLVELIAYERPETYVTAAWALAEINPKVGLLRSLKIAKERFQLAEQGISSRNEKGYERQVAHLCVWFGVAKFSPAGPFLESFVPKSNPLVFTRRSAIWGLGMLHEGHPQRELISRLKRRLADVDSPDPEDNIVRQQCAIAIGRMNDKQSVGFLREWRDRESPGFSVGAGCCWSLNRLVGEPLPKFDPVPGYKSGFFLERLSKPSAPPSTSTPEN